MRFPNYRKQIFEFFDEINRIHAQNDKRQMVLLLGIYSEYLTNELLRINFPKGNLEGIHSEKIKLDILKASRFIAESEYEVLNLLRKIRNEYAHKLYIDEEEVKKLMKKIKINWVASKEEIKKLDEKFNKMPFTKFQSGCIAKIVFLFQRLQGKLKTGDT